MSTLKYRAIVRFATLSEPYGLGTGELSITFTDVPAPLGSHPQMISVTDMAERLARFEWSGAQASISKGDQRNAKAVFADEIHALEEEPIGYWLLDITDHMTGMVIGWAIITEQREA